MDNNHIPLGERVAVLETEFAAVRSELTQIRGQLDELLHLKSQGMGALWLVSLLIGSGVLGVITVVLNFFNHPHL